MPLFLRKKRYLSNEMVIATYEEFRPWKPHSSFLIIYIGTIGFRRNTITHVNSPYIKSSWELYCGLDGKTKMHGGHNCRLYLDYGLSVQGITMGKVDLKDKYEIKSYLKKCREVLYPRFRSRLQNKIRSEET